MYEITYDYTDEGGFERRDITEIFKGTWTELQAYIRAMRRSGCYNIAANAVDGT